MPAKQGTSKSTDRAARNRKNGGRAGTSNRTATGTTQAGRPAPKKSSVPRPEDTLTGAIRNPGVGSMKEYDRRQWELKNGTRPNSPTQQSFVSHHAELALNYGSVTTLDGTAWTAAEKFLGFYVSITPDDLKAHQDPKIKRGPLAYEKTLASFPEEEHGAAKHGIGRAREALSAVFDEANGGDKTPEYQPKAKPTRSKSQTSNKGNQAKPASSETAGKPAAKKAAKPVPNRAAQHAERARQHELVSTLAYAVEPWAYQAAHTMLNHFRRLTPKQLTSPTGGKLLRTETAKRLAFDDLEKNRTPEEVAELTRGLDAAEDAINATCEEGNTTKTEQPAVTQSQSKPTLTVVPTPAQVFTAPKPVSVAS